MDSQDMTITYKAILDRAQSVALECMPELPKVPERKLYADSARGIYIPQYFAESVDRTKCDTPDEDLDLLAQGPEQDDYWDIWSDVLDSCVLTDSDGIEWTLHQDGDLWLVPANHYEVWESFASEVESLDAYEIAYESCEWDWVIYYGRALELCQAVPSSVLYDAESEWDDMDGGSAGGLYELATQLAAIIVTREIVAAVEAAKEELVELANEQMEGV